MAFLVSCVDVLLFFSASFIFSTLNRFASAFYQTLLPLAIISIIRKQFAPVSPTFALVSTLERDNTAPVCRFLHLINIGYCNHGNTETILDKPIHVLKHNTRLWCIQRPQTKNSTTGTFIPIIYQEENISRDETGLFVGEREVILAVWRGVLLTITCSDAFSGNNESKISFVVEESWIAQIYITFVTFKPPQQKHCWTHFLFLRRTYRHPVAHVRPPLPRTYFHFDFKGVWSLHVFVISLLSRIWIGASSGSRRGLSHKSRELWVFIFSIFLFHIARRQCETSSFGFLQYFLATVSVVEVIMYLWYVG